MLCKACNKTTNTQETEDCFENALDAIKLHYIYYKNALEQRDLELKQVKERNETLNKALELLQTAQQSHKRKKASPPTNSRPWLANIGNSEERTTSDTSLTDDEPIAATNLNMAINSEQLFETSSLSPGRNDVSTTSSECIISPSHKDSPKRNKQRENMLSLKERNHKRLEKSNTEWHRKERNSPIEKSWAESFLKPSTSKAVETKNTADLKKTEKRGILSLNRHNPSKMKQSLIHFNKPKEGRLNESDACEDIIESSPMVINKNSKAGRSLAHRSGNSFSSNNNNTSNNSTNVQTTNIAHKQDDIDKTLDGIVFDFSPTKKTEESLVHDKSPLKSQPKKLKFDNDISLDCISLPNDHLGISSSNKSDSSSVVILTPCTENIIFVDDTCDDEMDTMDLLADIMKPNNTENLKKYESKTIQKQQKNEMQQFKKPQLKVDCHNFIKPTTSIKQEKITQNLQDSTKPKENQITNNTTAASTSKQQNPLFSTNDQEYDDEEEEDDLMPKPFVVKQEPEVATTSKKLSFKERFNVDCDYCENYVKILGDNLTHEQIQQHINKCTRHNNEDVIRQNTPEDFWNPHILSFQPGDPRNEVLIDTRFKDIKH